MDNWKNKEQNKAKAIEHTGLMNMLHSQEISRSVNTTEVFTNVPDQELTCNPDQIYMNMDSVSALYSLCNEKIDRVCILNFASYKWPGGMFMEGSMAQEESLCHESDLYNILSSKRFEEYYEWNNQHKNHALYTNRALYIPDVVFTRDYELKADVLTCAAPNYSVAGRYQGISREGNLLVLKDRVRFIASILDRKKVQVFIAGAFGCGVFGQRAADVAQIWKETNFGSDLRKILHPVPGKDVNSRAFEERFSKHE